MRNTQLDSSVPHARSRRGADPAPGSDESVSIRYLPPILATLGAALLLLALFGILTWVSVDGFISLASSNGDLPQGNLLSTGACGIATLALLAGTLYFANAVRIAVRDLGARAVTLEGTISQRYAGRGRGGGYWIVIRPAGVEAPATPPSSAISVAADTALPVVAPRERGFVRGGSSFGAQLEAATGMPTPAAPAPVADIRVPRSRERLLAGEINLRVDKHMFEALTLGDRVQAVYSPHLEHVYYIRKRSDSGGFVVLRNPALI